MDSWAFSGELIWFAPLLGQGQQSWEHFAHQPCGRSIRLCIFSLECRNMDLQHPPRVQECRPLTPQDAGMIWLSRGDGILICLRSQTNIRKSPFVLVAQPLDSVPWVATGLLNKLASRKLCLSVCLSLSLSLSLSQSNPTRPEFNLVSTTFINCYLISMCHFPLLKME
jgi:hypothetical protein